MGFFSDLKEDLSQAVNELMPEEELKQELLEEEQEVQEEGQEVQEEQDSEVSSEDLAELDALLEKVDTIQVPEDMDITKMEEPEVSVEEEPEIDLETALEEIAVLDDTPEVDVMAELADVDHEETETEEEEYDLEASIRAAFGEKEEKDKGAVKMETQMRSVSDETAIITAGMKITGDIASEGSMEVIGTINGNVDILGKLNITGTIMGNSKAAEIYADNAKITGEIVSEGTVKIGQSSVIIGNISAKSAVIAGAVKGDIDVQGPVVLDTSAIVMGNIKSKSVQINNGAVIEGMCSQCYADVNPTSFFDEYKKGKNK